MLDLISKKVAGINFILCCGFFFFFSSSHVLIGPVVK